MCEHGEEFHLHPDLCLLYLIDEKGKLVGLGKRGKVVISNLFNRATVLFNYRLGDLAILDKHQCKCGRTFPLLKSLEGRKSDIIELPDGNLIDPNLVKNIFTKRQDVERYQVIQRKPLEFTVKVLPSLDASITTIDQELKKEFQGLFGDKAQVDVLLIKDFPTIGSEKYRPVIPLNE